MGNASNRFSVASAECYISHADNTLHASLSCYTMLLCYIKAILELHRSPLSFYDTQPPSPPPPSARDLNYIMILIYPVSSSRDNNTENEKYVLHFPSNFLNNFLAWCKNVSLISFFVQLKSNLAIFRGILIECMLEFMLAL